MLFPTITFAVFFLLVFIGNWLLMPRPGLWKPYILLASLVFYGWWEWRFLLLLVLSAVANQLFARAIERTATAATRKWLLVAAVAVNLGVLGWFKYYGFFVTSVVNLLGVFHLNADLPLLRIVLPVGVSFLTFRVLSYVVDVYRGTLRTSSLLDFGIYVTFFPYIMAGPIARANEFLPQLATPRDPRQVDTSRAFFLILGGLAKKMLIADYLATNLVNGVFTTPGEFTSLEVLLGIIGYSVQIYCDFSAYSDIAIGISLLLGFQLPDNFNAPYTAISVQDFWRRWHITLSRWLRDYVYIPLGGNRKGKTRTSVNIMLTMLLGGLWHGAGWPFIFWGALHGERPGLRASPSGRTQDPRAAAATSGGRERRRGRRGRDRHAALGRRHLAAPRRVRLRHVRLGVLPLHHIGGGVRRPRTAVPRLGQPRRSRDAGPPAGDRSGDRHPVRAARRVRESRGQVLDVQSRAAGRRSRDRLPAARHPRTLRPGDLPLLPLLMSDRHREKRPLQRRRRTAASALVAILVAFALGVLLNAPAMKKSAMELPFGGERSFRLALVGPLATVSHWVFLDRPGRLVAEALGKPDPGGPWPSW